MRAALADPSAKKHGLRAEPFHAEVGRTTQCPGSVTGPRRDGHALPRLEPDFAATLELDSKASGDDDEQLVRGWMKVPTIRLLEDGQSQTAVVDATDHHVPIGLGYRCSFPSQIDDLERAKAHRLVCIAFGR